MLDAEHEGTCGCWQAASPVNAWGSLEGAVSDAFDRASMYITTDEASSVHSRSLPKGFSCIDY